MEELIDKIDELIIAINNNSIPLWLSIVGILIPIFISIVVAIQAYIQHNSNKKLQMYISEKEARIQMHGDFLAIYDSFCIAQKCIGPSRNKMDEIFANPNILSQWYDDLHKASFGLCQSTNRALLLLPESDTNLRNTLDSLFKKYRDLVEQIYDYISTGKVEYDRGQAWSKLNPQYGIFVGNYAMLSSNPVAYGDYIKLFSNEKTKQISETIKELLPLFEYEKFDKFFEPYLRITPDMKENRK